MNKKHDPNAGLTKMDIKDLSINQLNDRIRVYSIMRDLNVLTYEDNGVMYGLAENTTADTAILLFTHEVARRVLHE